MAFWLCAKWYLKSIAKRNCYVQNEEEEKRRGKMADNVQDMFNRPNHVQKESQRTAFRKKKKEIRPKGEQKSTGRINDSFLVYASDVRIHRVLDGRGDAG